MPGEQLKRPRKKIGTNVEFCPWTELPPIPDDIHDTKRMSRPGVGLGERIIGVFLVILLAPLMLLLALAIKITSPGGPVLYRQVRVGLDRRCLSPIGIHQDGQPDRRKTPGVGQLFQIYKFRTMVPDAEQQTGPVWALKADPRITPLGQVLRHLRLDELPQLFNIIQGQMRLIGPRPERPHFVKDLCVDIPDYPYRQAVPPGITGLAQVVQGYDSSVDDVRKKVKYDLFYVRNKGYMMDMKILIRTIDVVLRGRGAH